MPDFPATASPMRMEMRGSLDTMSGPLTDMPRIAGSTLAAAAWPTANKAFYVPIYVERTVTVYQIGWENGGTIAGTNHIDVGIYQYPGWKRLVSAGATTLTGTTTMQVADISDTTLTPGVYFLAMVLDSNTDTIWRWNPNGYQAQLGGVLEQTSAYPLPDPGVPVIPTVGYVPAIYAFTTST